LLMRCLFLGILVLQAVFLFYFRSMYLWDGAFVVGGANSLLQDGAVSQDAYYYLSVYTNQHPFVIVTAALLWLGQRLSLGTAGQYLLLNIANTVCLDMAVVFLIKCQSYLLREKPERERAGSNCYLLLLLALNPFVYVFAAYYYTIFLSLPFFTAGMYFSLKVLDGDGRSLIRAGILFGMGYAIRATTVIPVIACIFAGFVTALLKKESKRFFQPVLLCALALLTGTLLCLGAQRLVGIDTRDTAFPATHWLMMSLTSPGCHNEEDEAFTASFATREEKKRAVSERLVYKLEQLGAGGYAKLAVDKLLYTWESGNHAYSFFTGNALRTGGAYEWIYGGHKDVLALYGQGCYLFLLGSMLLLLVRSFFFAFEETGNQRKGLTFFFCLTLLGGFLFYILWETGTQYSLVFFPLFFLLASLAPHASRNTARNTGRLREIPIPVLMGAGAAVFVLFTVFVIKERTVFTAQTYERRDTVTLQLLANAPYELKADERMVQKIKAARSFDELIFQYRNFLLDEENDSVYHVSFYGRDGLLWEDRIIAKGQPQNGAFVKDFPPLPAGDYELEIRREAGSEGKTLSFVTYEMGGYDAYTDGALLVDGTPEAKDLMMGLYHKGEGCYVTAAGYGCFWLVLLLCFLFWEICCILLCKCGIKEGKSE
ncbi:MAG: hypothetical protein IJ711_06975, partial [Lachnospiraceae bacterium]|nr:hypothetical protein [Lachnospiraceae bacterium]